MRFEQKLAQAEALAVKPAAQQAYLTEALALYGGDLLPTCYDDWIIPERDRLRDLYQNGLVRASRLAEMQHDYVAAIHYANELQRLAPLHEAAYGRLMRLHMRNQDRAAALQTYQSCAIKLKQELGVEPGVELQNVHKELLQTAQQPSTQSRAHIAGQSLVGRQTEWQALVAAWQQATRKHVHFCVLSGEAGIGKTHLAEAMLDWAEQQGFLTATAHLFEAAASLVYTPLVDWLHEPSLYAALLQMDKIWLSQLSRLLPEVLVEHPDLPVPPLTSDQWQRRQLFDALVRIFSLGDRPKILLIDDLQWCDSETLAWLRYLLSFAHDDQHIEHSHQPLLILATVRREELDDNHPLTQWLIELRSTQQIAEIALAPLDPAATGQLAAQVGRMAFNAEQTGIIYQLTGGNPLFVVEMVRAGMDLNGSRETEAGAYLPFPLDQLNSASTKLPPKVQAVIQGRLGRLSSSARHTANVAAAIGRAFSFDLLQRIIDLQESFVPSAQREMWDKTLLGNYSNQSEAALTSALDELWRRGIIRVRAVHRYDFNHARIREVVYAELSPIQKPLLHRQVAQALETMHADNLAVVSAKLPPIMNERVL